MNHGGHLPLKKDHPSSIPYPNRTAGTPRAHRPGVRVGRPFNLPPSHAPTPYPPQCDGRPFQSDAAVRCPRGKGTQAPSQPAICLTPNHSHQAALPAAQAKTAA
ncbi:hypothetical protein PVAP13_9KG636150 [Panicum virgatum]|uniref:Uncharacterized protein n=1 Tax=Panicum virgatum TaxID=38727 RepID=A0A8T0P3Z2_PANVG|nr:hypothetical protein PVAP13_9KG636150 [Panicum virgatum]